MCKWKIISNENILPPIFVLVKVDFTDSKILGGKYNPICYPVEQFKTVYEEEIVEEATK